MIAYNLCYSTCLGRLKEFMGTNRLGTSSLAVPPGCLTLLKDLITCTHSSHPSCAFETEPCPAVSPNGLMFLKPQVRRSMLSKMLTEILDTRVMVKKSMKLVDDVDRALIKLLNARQLGLKFIANVTYGYTSATFSGRMPCVEIADAIVQTGRETLERVRSNSSGPSTNPNTLCRLRIRFRAALTGAQSCDMETLILSSCIFRERPETKPSRSAMR